MFDSKTGMLKLVCLSVLREGSDFGEKGLNDNTTRNATVVCVTDCVFACISRRDYEKHLKHMNMSQQSKLNDFFFTHVFKQAVAKSETESLCEDFCKLTLTLPKGSIVFQQGCLDNRVYIIKQGTILLEHKIRSRDSQLVELQRKDAHYRNYQVAKIGTGEFLGEECIFKNKPKIFSAKVISDSVILFVATKQCLKGHLKVNEQVKDYFEEIYKAKNESRKELLKKLIKNWNALVEEEPTENSTASKEVSAKIPGWTRPVHKPEPYVDTFDDFDKKYNNEFASFVRKKANYHDPHFQMLDDFEQKMKKCIIPANEIKLMEDMLTREYMVTNRDYFELQDIRALIKDPKKELLLHLSEKAKGRIQKKNLSLTLDNSNYDKVLSQTASQNYSLISKAQSCRPVRHPMFRAKPRRGYKRDDSTLGPTVNRLSQSVDEDRDYQFFSNRSENCSTIANFAFPKLPMKRSILLADFNPHTPFSLRSKIAGSLRAGKLANTMNIIKDYK